jgi:hypothetical protein
MGQKTYETEIVELLATAGENILRNYLDTKMDKDALYVYITFGPNPNRLVYDKDFGFLWYNSEGPEE